MMNSYDQMFSVTIVLILILSLIFRILYLTTPLSRGQVGQQSKLDD